MRTSVIISKTKKDGSVYYCGFVIRKIFYIPFKFWFTCKQIGGIKYHSALSFWKSERIWVRNKEKLEQFLMENINK
jgi:hypothetical protein